MQYENPYGVFSPYPAPYINGNPATGVAGSIPDAAVFQNPQTEIVNAITLSGFTPTDNDLFQLSRAIRQGNNYEVASGTANNYAVTTNLQLAGYEAGLTIRVQIPITNTGDSYINIDGLGLRHIINTNGTILAAGQLVASGIAELVDDGTELQLVNGSGGGATGPAGATGAAGPAGPGSPVRILYEGPGTSGTLTVASSGETRAKVRGWAGGGGGGGSFGANSGGAGGGGGGFFEILVTGLTPSQTISWSVGSGGAAGNASPTGGGNGGGTVFGIYATANGGGGGGPGNGTFSVAPGFGGTVALGGGAVGLTVTGYGGGAAALINVPAGSGYGIYAGVGGGTFGTSTTGPGLSDSVQGNTGLPGNSPGGGAMGGGWGAAGAAGGGGFLIIEMLP